MRWRPGRWTREHETPLAVAFLACVALAVAADVWLVFWAGVPSITERVWAACAAHPVVVAAGVLATVLVGWLVRTDWRLVLLAGILGGHLFTCI